jgi:long-chain acyl-CoA synthetase
MNFANRIAETAARFPDRTAIERVGADGGLETTTYSELIARAGAASAWLTSTGIVPGDRVAILADNDAAWIAAYLGILRMGAVAVPLDTAYKGAQVHAVLENATAAAILTTAKYSETVRAAVAMPRRARTTLTLLPSIVDATADVRGTPDLKLEPPQIHATAPTDAAVILYTSGTTADPKGVVLTHANLEAERTGAFAIVDVSEVDAVLGVLPLFHALAQMANLLLPLSVGARVVFLETVSSTSLVEQLTARRITIFACVPQFFYLIHQRVMSELARKGRVIRGVMRALIALNVRLRDAIGWNPARRLFSRVHRALGPEMRLLITGGSKFDAAIARDLYGLGFTILNAYGLTETSGGATIQRPRDRFTSSVGQPFPGVEIQIAPAASADDGEILIRGPIVMREYFGRPDATAEALVGGWLHTGDLGRVDADGSLYITGRLKEIIVLSSGKNLYPEEIEAHYGQSAFLKELCVIGLTRPDEPSAERLHAVIVPDAKVLTERGIVNLKELVRFELETLSVSLPAHKRILTYDITLEALPRTTTGKIKRHEVEKAAQARAAAAAEGETRDATATEREWLADDSRREWLDRIAKRLNRAVVRPDANLELDLGLDSMERVELLTMIERGAGTRVAADVRAAIFTVRQLVDAVLAGERVAGDGAVDNVAGGAAGEPGGDLAWDLVLATPADDAILVNLRRGKTLTAIGLFAVARCLSVLARVAWGYTAKGQQHLPATGAFIVSPNHQTFVDGIFLSAALPYPVFRRLFLVGAAEFFETRFMAWLARKINVVPVDPDTNLVTAMRAGASGLRLDKVLVLFPEGERSIDGTPRKFRKGAAILSAHVGVPIVPVAIDGLYEIWPRGRRLNWRRLLPWSETRITVEFGVPIRGGRDDYDAGTAALKAAVERMFYAGR